MKTHHDPLNVAVFAEICDQQTDRADYPLATHIEADVVCYSAALLSHYQTEAAAKQAIQQELVKVLQSGPGVFVIQGFFDDLSVIHAHNNLLDELFEQQSGCTGADHFAQAGANGRIWNSLQKAALHSPERYLDYYKNPLFTLISEAWLGPHYQLTAQVNVVRPGGEAQAPHRDYHLGFQHEALLKHYPPHVHSMSSMLTLQGAVAHTDMPIESGPTLLLPFSQQYPEGYLAWRNDDFKTYFDQHAIQLALKQGDAMFFNPALFHAAGSNQTTDFHRIANLFQVSSAFGRAMETVERESMCLAIYPALLEKIPTLSELELEAVLNNTCEGYSFPTNLDTDPPSAGMAPQTQKQLMQCALASKWPLKDFRQSLHEQTTKRLG